MRAHHELARFAVLVVEDEPILLMSAMDLAEEAGFNAYGATNADEAIHLLEEHDDIRILFTDVDMPGSMDGLRLAHAVRDRWPPVTIIVTSGHAKLSIADLPLDGTFVPKPYVPELLLRQLRNIGERLAA